MWTISCSRVPAGVAAGILLLATGSFGLQQAPSDQSQTPNAKAPEQSQPAAQQPSASQPPQSQPATPPKLKAMESMLVSRIHMVNQMEIKAGQMAAKKGSTYAVREYGDRLQLDHKMADNKVLAYAKAHGLEVMSPPEIMAKMQQMAGSVPEAETKPQQMEQQGMSPQSGMPPTQEMQQQMSKIQSTMQQLQGLNGNAFDYAFTQFMEQGHTQAIAMLSMAQDMLPASSGLRSMLGRFIPVLEQHYDIASRLHIAAVRRQNRELGDQLSAKMKGGQ